jgi:hypothetical protein
MSSTSSAPSSPHFSLLEIPSSPAQSIATPRLYGFCYKVETTHELDMVTSYSIELNPHAEECPAPCKEDCANSRLGEPTPGEPWRNYDYLSCLASQGLFHLAQDTYKTNADIHVQIMRCTDNPNLLHANVIKAWGERRANPQDSDASSCGADADSESSSMPSLEAMSLVELPPPQRPDSPYPFPSVVQAQQVLTYKEQANRLISIACRANNDPSGCDSERGTYPYCCAFHHHCFCAYKEHTLVTYPTPASPASSDILCEWTRNLQTSAPSTPSSPPGFTVKKPLIDSLRSCWHCHQQGHKKAQCPDRTRPRARVHYLRDRHNLARRSAGSLKESKARRIERREAFEIYKTIESHASWANLAGPKGKIRDALYRRVQDFIIDML